MADMLWTTFSNAFYSMEICYLDKIFAEVDALGHN